MKTFKLKIELLSDLCVADGGIYNSSIDTDICKDEYGLPYIPSKRIKGCLRECAQELSDWGENVCPSLLFGDKGESTKKGKVRISDALLTDYSDYVSEIVNGNPVVYHPQNVLKNFSYTRTQTKINEDGVAEQTSLRTIRVVNKGLVFESNVILADDSLAEDLSKCCSLFRNMGLARTRGLGEIKCTLSECAVSDAPRNEVSIVNETTLKYRIKLLEPMICKSINGGESNSYDYIEGSKIIGLLAKTINSRDRFIEILSDPELVFSNAYIEKQGMRMTEAPAYLYSIKNNKKNYINRLVYSETNNETKKRQINSMKHCYISFENEVLNTSSVEMEERYHHSRPEDKSIGRALDDENSKFYQISSIRKGQVFSGFISGSQPVIKAVYEYLSTVSECTLGYGSASEYGRCEFSIEPEVRNEDNEKERGKEFVVSLISPAIVYNSRAMYSTHYEDLLQEIFLACGLELTDISKLNEEESKRFMKYTNLGGYNVTWNERKPVVGAFDKGTAIKLVFNEEVCVKSGTRAFIGERNQEGYGECRIEKLNVSGNEDAWVYKDSQSEHDNTCAEKVTIGASGELGKEISKRLFCDYIRMTAAELIRNSGKATGLVSEKNRSTISNMLLMCSEMENMDAIVNAVDDRFGKESNLKKDKYEVAQKIINLVNTHFGEKIDEFCKQMQIDRAVINLSDDEIKKNLLNDLLLELKYRIRANVKKGDGTNE